jgi:DNA adenine methylase
MKSPSWGYRPKRSLPPERWKERINPCGEKLENVEITNLDFSEVINAPAKGKKVLIFLDPPYYKAKQENHYTCPFKKEDHVRLAKELKKTKYSFFLTYDDCPEVRELYSWANIYEVSFFYRLDNSTDNNGKRKKGFELIITNYKLEEDKLK